MAYDTRDCKAKSVGVEHAEEYCRRCRRESTEDRRNHTADWSEKYLGETILASNTSLLVQPKLSMMSSTIRSDYNGNAPPATSATATTIPPIPSNA